MVISDYVAPQKRGFLFFDFERLVAIAVSVGIAALARRKLRYSCAASVTTSASAIAACIATFAVVHIRGARVALSQVVAAGAHFVGVKSEKRRSYNLKVDFWSEYHACCEDEVGRSRTCCVGVARSCCFRDGEDRVEEHSAGFKVESEGRRHALALTRDIHTVQCKVVGCSYFNRNWSTGRVGGFDAEFEISGASAVGHITFQHDGKEHFPRARNFCEEEVAVVVALSDAVVAVCGCAGRAGSAKVSVISAAWAVFKFSHDAAQVCHIAAVFCNQSCYRETVYSHIRIGKFS